MGQHLKTALILFTAALVAAGIFLLALHPVSGILGGLFYFIVGQWLLPTVFVTLVALGIVFLMPLRATWRVVAALLVAPIVGLNTQLFDVLKSFSYRPAIQSSVRRPLQLDINAVRRISFKTHAMPLVQPDRNIGPTVAISSNEGCGCMAFIARPTLTYFEHVRNSLRSVVGLNADASRTLYNFLPADRQHDTYLDFQISKTASGFRATVDVFNSDEKTASFVHENIPAETAGTVLDRGGSLTVDFLPHALDILLHSSIWTIALDCDHLSRGYFPKDEFEKFIQAAFSK